MSFVGAHMDVVTASEWDGEEGGSQTWLLVGADVKS